MGDDLKVGAWRACSVFPQASVQPRRVTSSIGLKLGQANLAEGRA
jgi:hypothetical protein